MDTEYLNRYPVSIRLCVSLQIWDRTERLGLGMKRLLVPGCYECLTWDQLQTMRSVLFVPQQKKEM